jgi:superoxide dismutase
MGGRGASSGIRRGKASNAKYNGFSITDEKGNTNHYIVIGGKISMATTKNTRGSLVRYFDSNHPFQKAYDKYGNVDAIIKRVNKVGKGKASILSDKAVEKMNDDYAKELANRKTDYTVRSSKKGVNRHKLYWSAM